MSLRILSTSRIEHGLHLVFLWAGLALGCQPGSTKADAGPCAEVVTEYKPDEGYHVGPGTPMEWNSNPPSSGVHFGSWVPWARVYEEPMERGYWVHNLEHGGVALLYNCSGDCDEVALGLEELGDSLLDPLCTAPINARWLVSPDPLLPEGVAVAAAAWGWTYTARCVDQGSLGAFIAEHYDEAPESSCMDGVLHEDAGLDDGGVLEGAGDGDVSDSSRKGSPGCYNQFLRQVPGHLQHEKH